MPAIAAIRAGRRWAESLMVDACIIRRTIGPPGELNPETGERTPAPTEAVYTGKCKVQTYEAHESKPDAGEHVFTVQRYSVHIPVSAPAIAVDDRIEITAAVADPHLIGRTYRVSGLLHKSLATAQRLLVDEVVA